MWVFVGYIPFKIYLPQKKRDHNIYIFLCVIKHMANEAILRVETAPPINATVMDTNAIEKGAILVLSDPLTVSGGTALGTGNIFGGIAAAEKIAKDGKTKMPVYMDGIFDLVTASGGAVTIGQIVTNSGANLIRTATEAEIAAGKGIGKALETRAEESEAERIQVFVGHM